MKGVDISPVDVNTKQQTAMAVSLCNLHNANDDIVNDQALRAAASRSKRTTTEGTCGMFNYCKIRLIT